MTIYNEKNIIPEIREKDKTILSIYFPAPLTLYQYHIFPFCMLFTNKTAVNILNNYYIQLAFCQNEELSPLDFYPSFHFTNKTTEYMKILELNDKVIDMQKDRVIDYIIAWIDNGYYTYFNVDENQIPGTYSSSKKEPHLHAIFIFGYDKSGKTLKSINYDTHRSVSIIDIDFDVFKRAFASEKTIGLLHATGWGRGYDFVINLFKVKERLDVKLNPYLIKKQLEEYLSAHNSSLDHELFLPGIDTAEWGMHIYPGLERYLDQFPGEQRIDYRIFHGLWEHKMIMANRITCLQENRFIGTGGKLLPGIMQMAEDANELRLSALKYKHSITKDSLLQEEMKKQLLKIRDNEKPLLEHLLNELEKNQSSL